MFTIDDLGRPARQIWNNVVGKLVATCGHDQTCIVRYVDSGICTGWLPMADVQLVEEPKAEEPKAEEPKAEESAA